MAENISFGAMLFLNIQTTNIKSLIINLVITHQSIFIKGLQYHQLQRLNVV